MHFSWKRWRLVLIAALTAIAISVTFTGEAFAYEPGEDDAWAPEGANGQQIATRDNLGQARNGGNLLDVWRGADNDAVWLSWNNGAPFTLGTTATDMAPTVVPWGPNAGFMVFHVGTDAHIYYTYVYSDRVWSGTWNQVPGQTTSLPVSAAQLGEGSYNVYMTYQGLSDDGVYGTYYGGPNVGWQAAVNIAGGITPSAPSVTYNPVSQHLYVVVRGNDNQVWMNSQPLGGGWGGWVVIGATTTDTPTIAAGSNGIMTMAIRDSNLHTWYLRFWNNGAYIPNSLSQDITGWQSLHAPTLVAYGVAVVALLTGLNRGAVWKQAYDGS